MTHSDFLVKPGRKVSLKDFDAGAHGEFDSKDAASEKLAADIRALAEMQDIFYASDTYSLLIIFQAMDAAGKDGAIKHVMSGLNPQGCQVASFKAPSSLELDHDYLWRSTIALPERGHIGIFNRSYYEELLVVRVHPQILDAQKLPEKLKKEGIWKRRYQEINYFEQYLTDNGTKIVKFFLNLSKGEQKRRFLERINNPAKNWKLSPADVKERAFWDDYERAYEEVLAHTSTEAAPWYVVPADHKWFTRTVIADVLVKTLKSLHCHYPEPDKAHLAALQESKKVLEAE
ncbi:MAG: polyphosphate kinase 2 family protein [Verrucomicrobiae bacterium]